MRLTAILCRHNYYRVIQRVWKKQGKMEIAPVEVPPELKEMGVKIYDAIDVAKGTEELKCSAEEEIVTSGKTYFVFDNKVKVTGGEEQLLALTKTLPYQGLTPVVSSLVGKEVLPDQDTIVRNHILAALTQDGDLHKLPKIVDVKQPGKYFARTYGARNKRKCCNLMQKLALLSSMACSKYSESLLRSKNIDAFTELTVDRAGQSVTFQMCADILLSSEKAMEPVASPEEVEQTKDIAVPSTYPVFPTLDLHVFDENPLKRPSYNILECEQRRNLRVHTLHVVQQSFGFWKAEQKVCRAIATCFTFAAEEARILYGPDVLILPKPVTLQCIYSDIKAMGFLTYQLNTLDLRDDAGIKNQVWIENPQDFYSEIHELKGMTNYNNEIFPKMLGFYLNGLHPQSL